MIFLGDFIELKQIDINAKKDLLVFNGQNFYSLIFNPENLILTIRGNSTKVEEISYVSNNCEEFLNYKKQDLIGQKLKMIIPNPIANFHEGYIKKYLETGYSTIIDQIKNAIILKKYDDPMYVMQFVKYYPCLSDDIYFTGVVAKTDLKSSIMIIDNNFNMKYISSSILSELNIDLEMFKKLKLEIPFYILCPNILKFFKITENKIHNKSNSDGDLNQVVLDFFIPPFFNALIKEMMNMRNNATDSTKIIKDEEITRRMSLNMLKSIKRMSYDHISIDKERLLPSYKSIIKNLYDLYDNEDYDTIYEVLRTLYRISFSEFTYPLTCKKAKIDFSNFQFNENKNLVLCEIRFLGTGIVKNTDEIFVQEIELDDQMVQGN
jgi:hypothetical protein